MTVALLVLHFEVLALVAAGGFLAAEVVLGRVQYLGPSVATALFAWVLAFLLGLSGRALWRFKRWGRGPVITWQLLQGVVAITQLGGTPVLRGVLVALSVLVIVGLLAPASVEATAGEPGEPA